MDYSEEQKKEIATNIAAAACSRAITRVLDLLSDEEKRAIGERKPGTIEELASILTEEHEEVTARAFKESFAQIMDEFAGFTAPEA